MKSRLQKNWYSLLFIYLNRLDHLYVYQNWRKIIRHNNYLKLKEGLKIIIILFMFALYLTWRKYWKCLMWKYIDISFKFYIFNCDWRFTDQFSYTINLLFSDTPIHQYILESADFHSLTPNVCDSIRELSIILSKSPPLSREVTDRHRRGQNSSASGTGWGQTKTVCVYLPHRSSCQGMSLPVFWSARRVIFWFGYK